MQGNLTRRAVLAGGVGLVASAVAMPLLDARGGGVPVAEAAALTTQQTNANRAVAAYNAMQKYFSVPDGSSLYRETYPWGGGNKYYPVQRCWPADLGNRPGRSSARPGSYDPAVRPARLELRRVWQADLTRGSYSFSPYAPASQLRSHGPVNQSGEGATRVE
jgi:hypothetical protein